MPFTLVGFRIPTRLTDTLLNKPLPKLVLAEIFLRVVGELPQLSAYPCFPYPIT